MQLKKVVKTTAPVLTHDQINTQPKTVDLNRSSKSPSRENSIRLFIVLMDESKPLSTACRALSIKQKVQMNTMSTQEFGERFKSMLENEPSDVRLESIKPILKFTINQPAICALISKVEHAKNKSA